MARAKRRRIFSQHSTATAQPALRATPKADAQSSVGAVRTGFHRGGLEREAHVLLRFLHSGHSSLCRSNTVLQLQRTHGNRYIQRVLESAGASPGAAIESLGMRAGPESPVQRKDVADSAVSGSTVETDQLVGLKENDGMTDKTINKRPRVMELQKRLNLKINANLKVDGKFGPQTLEALNDFQKSRKQQVQNEVDAEVASALTDGKKPGPNPKPPNKPAINPLLEDKLDEAMANYQIMLLRERDGLVSLERDLSKKDHPSFTKELITAAIEGGLEFALGPAHGLLSFPIKTFFDAVSEPEIEPTPTPTDENAHKHHHENLAKAGITEVFEKMVEVAVKRGVESGEELTDKKRPSLDIFIDSQRAALLDANVALQERFFTVTKNAFRADVPGVPSDAKEPEFDPRLIEAQKYVKSIQQGHATAHDDQYAGSLAAWASALAQSKEELGSQEVVDPLKPNKKKKVTDLRKRKFGAGVLQVTIEGGDPERRVRIVGLRITGLPETTLRKLEQRGEIGKLNLPRRAVGKIKHGKLEGEISIAKNEANEVLDTGNSADGHDWLKLKGQREGIIVDDFAKAGAKQVWHEIDNHELSKNELKS